MILVCFSAILVVTIKFLEMSDDYWDNIMNLFYVGQDNHEMYYYYQYNYKEDL